jgi:tetratricopeptide (TPR) repeat protein
MITLVVVFCSDLTVWLCLMTAPRGVELSNQTLGLDSLDSQVRAAAAVFALNGEYWTIEYAGKTFSLKASKGLAYLFRLIQHPGEEFHVLDLMGGPGSSFIPESTAAETSSTDSSLTIGRLGDAGEMLDGKAKQDYRRRLVELREQMENAQELGNSERVAEIESEIDFLAREISRAIGLGGRDRRAGSAAERARLNVSRAIKAALEKISEHHYKLGEKLNQSIRTGTFCSYVPDSLASTVSKLSLNSLEPAASSDSTAPVLPINEFGFAEAAIGRTTFVGREQELAQLRNLLQQAMEGRGRIAMISGDAGVGKTRLATEVATQAWRSGVRMLVGKCYDQDDALPYGPFVEMLEEALKPTVRSAFLRDALGSDASDIARVLPQLRRLYADIPPPLELPPEQSRRVLFNAVTELLGRMASGAPLLLLLDDLQWADDGTLLLLNHLARSAPKMPVLMVGTYRDFEVDPAGRLVRTLDELIRLHLVERITLRGLPQSAVAEMLCGLSGKEPPEKVTAQIYTNTEGNPFFVEELVLHLIEQNRLIDSCGEFFSGPQLVADSLPQNLRLIIGRRLARLGDVTQKVLGTAAIIGRSFTFELLQASTSLEASPLLDRVEEAERAGLISATVQKNQALFHFAHELIRQTAIGMLSVHRRQRLHVDVADALERIHADAPEEQAVELVHHLAEAGSAADSGRMLRFLTMAVKRELEESACESAARHAQTALELLNRLPALPERDQRELDLQIAYGVAMTATEGAHVREVGDAYRRARELCGGLGDDPRLFLVSYGLWNIHLLHAELPVARPYADGLVELAQHTGDEGLAVQAYWVLGCNQFFMGEFAAARGSLAESIRRYDKERHRSLKFRFAQDPCVSCLSYDALALWMLGCPEQAEKRIAESLALAREASHPYTLAWCLHHLVIYRIFRRQFSAVEEVSREGLDLCKRYGFAFLEAPTIVYANLARVFLGLKRDERDPGGLDLTRPATAGDTLMGTWYLGELADALGNRGKVDKTFAILAQALHMVERSQERYFESEIHCIKGELILKQFEAAPGDSADVQSAQSTAEQSFRNALEIAQLRGAKIQELRAATGLSRLLIASGRRGEARRVLEEICNWFTEGLDTPQLTAAKSVLDGLPAA